MINKRVIENLKYFVDTLSVVPDTPGKSVLTVHIDDKSRSMLIIYPNLIEGRDK